MGEQIYVFIYHLETPEINHWTSHPQFWEPALIQLKTPHSSFLVFCQNIETTKQFPSLPRVFFFFFTVTSRLLMSSAAVADQIHAGQDLPAIRRLSFSAPPNKLYSSFMAIPGRAERQTANDRLRLASSPSPAFCMQSAAAAAAAECLSRSLVECLCN